MMTKTRNGARYLGLAACLAAFAAVPAGAQTLSVRGGASLATIAGDDVDDTSSRTGINVGAAVTFPLSGNLGLQLGAGYVQKGASMTEDDAELTFGLDYFEVPVLLHIGVPTAGNISPHFVVGPAIGISAGCEIEGSTEGVSATIDCSELDIETKSIDIGAMGGAGLDIATSGPVTITLDVLYNLGLSTFDGTSPAEDVKHRAWSFLAGISLGIG